MKAGVKYSGVAWIGNIPESWRISKVKDAFVRKNQKAHQENPVVLSLARSGVRVRDISTNEGQVAESYYDYNPVEIDDLLINPMDLYSGANCSISKVSGVISPAYVNLRYKKNVCPRFYDYYFKTQYWAMAFFAHGKGISFDNRWTLGIDTLLNYPIPSPSYVEQKAIADFLDKKCGEVDELVALQEKIIEELKSYKQSVITEAVCKGLNPNVPMKDSGIDWVGKMPTHWEVCQLKRYSKVNNGKEVINESNDSSTIPVYGSGGVFKYTETALYQGEVVMFGRKGTLGKPIYANTKLWVVDTMYFLTFDKKHLLPRYVYYQLTTFDWQPYITQTALPSIVASDIVACNFPKPIISEQQEIADYLDKKCSEIDQLISIKQQKIVELNDYKKSLIYEYTTGKKEVKL